MRGGATLDVEYETNRAELLPLIPPCTRSVLDVGCSSGKFAALLRGQGVERIVGIDPLDDEGGAFDLRIIGFYPDDAPAERFDLVTFNDVLEHLRDPWAALERTHDLLSASGTVIASIPNVRNVPRVLAPLALRGRWDYRGWGILNRDHVRFFTRATMREMFEDCGYRVEQVVPINVMEKGRWAALNRASGGRLVEFLAIQFAVVARAER